LLARIGSALLRDPGELLAAGVMYKKGRRGHSARVVLDGHPYFLKQYYSRGGIYRFIDLFRGSRGLKAWHVALRMLEAGLAIPQPLIYAEERQYGVWQNGYLLMDFVEGATDFRNLWEDSDFERRMLMAGRAGTAIAILHKNRFVHGDLKWYNILCVGDSLELVFADLDGARRTTLCRRRAAASDLARFLADFGEVADGGEGRRVFLAAYWADLC
jgi:tRNA A-37 threonylcarbamoyl transferase component Bud32